ncbi:MAG: homoserine O-succinyltransferase [Thiothrix sp.]|nr:MAG: homoserine O-succinyltransferase [Thiothrix sp.]
MPLVDHTGLPTFNRLRKEGNSVLTPERASDQYIRELHIGLLNMMPDAALESTERQFFRLVGESNPIAQFYMHPFTLDELPRGEKARKHIEQYYDNFTDIQRDGLDALIITGANVIGPELSTECFWEPLTRVIDWAAKNVTSTLCSCLATHAVLQYRHGQTRRHMEQKRWGVFSHSVLDKSHPLVNDVNTQFDAPHSRFNQIDRSMFEAAGLHILAESAEGGVHIAVSDNGLRTVYFQGHPEYDTISLMKEYKREIIRYAKGELKSYPLFPEHYFDLRTRAILDEYRDRLIKALNQQTQSPEFPEVLISPMLDNTWHDTGEAIVGNWIGLVYQVTNKDRKYPFMEGVNPDDPLGLKPSS